MVRRSPKGPTLALDLARRGLVLMVIFMGCAEVDTDSSSRMISVACMTSPGTRTTLHQWELTVLPTLALGDEFGALLGGTVIFKRAFLNQLVELRKPGPAGMHVHDLHATVRVRSGATGDPVTLVPELPYRCLDDPEVTCDPAHDEPANAAGNRRNADCDDPLDGFQNPCGQFVEFPTSTDCDGVCESLGAGTLCRSSTGLCVVDDLEIKLEERVGLYVADPSATTVLFGWEDDESETGAQRKFNGTEEVWELAPASIVEPTGAIGLRANLGAEFPPFLIGFNCTMGVDSFDPEALGPTIVTARPTPAEMLLAIPIRR